MNASIEEESLIDGQDDDERRYPRHSSAHSLRVHSPSQSPSPPAPDSPTQSPTLLFPARPSDPGLTPVPEADADPAEPRTAKASLSGDQLASAMGAYPPAACLGGDPTDTDVATDSPGALATRSPGPNSLPIGGPSPAHSSHSLQQTVGSSELSGSDSPLTSVPAAQPAVEHS